MAEIDILARLRIKVSKAVSFRLDAHNGEMVLAYATIHNPLPVLSHLDVDGLKVTNARFEPQLERDEPGDRWTGRIIAYMDVEALYSVENDDVVDAMEDLVNKLTGDELYYQEFLDEDTEGWAFGDGYLTDTEVMAVRASEESAYGL